MDRPYRHLDVECQGDVYCARLTRTHLDEAALNELGQEMTRLVDEGCRKLVLSLGPDSPQCMYSVFLAKLVTLRRRLHECGGSLKITDAGPDTLRLFEVCRLRDYFDFTPDRSTAIASFVK